MNKKFSLSVGICALNEEANIKTIINNILSQKARNFNLVEVLVVCDGSTDLTPEKAKEIRDNRIKVICFNDRQGKVQRLNYIFRHAKGEIIACSDADTVLSDSESLNRLIKPITINQKIGIVGGRLVPLQGRSFVEQSVNYSREVWDGIRKDMKNGNSVYSCTGALFAVSRKLAKKIIFPKAIWSELGYLYMSCITSGYDFFSEKNVEILFRSPANLTDYFKQITRYVSEIDSLPNYFDKNTIKAEYNIPKKLLYKHKLHTFINHPINLIFIFFVNSISKLNARLTKNKHQALWDSASSTKSKL